MPGYTRKEERLIRKYGIRYTSYFLLPLMVFGSFFGAGYSAANDPEAFKARANPEFSQKGYDGTIGREPEYNFDALESKPCYGNDTGFGSAARKQIAEKYGRDAAYDC